MGEDERCPKCGGFSKPIAVSGTPSRTGQDGEYVVSYQCIRCNWMWDVRQVLRWADKLKDEVGE
jgi:hypothetical protein